MKDWYVWIWVGVIMMMLVAVIMQRFLGGS